MSNRPSMREMLEKKDKQDKEYETLEEEGMRIE